MQSWRRPVVTAAAVVAVAVNSAPVAAQYQTRTWLSWRTVQTEHFSVHYPIELETWARAVASKMEGVDSAVSLVVGYRPPRRIQIVVDDPYGISNGSAWPFLNGPALVFWATPPSPREDVGTYVSWTDMLASHEFAHLAHLTRPSRNPFVQAVWNLFPVHLGPIPRKVPRWVIEGYATYVEGIITGSGRPNGAWRPTILRRWAIEGKLPTYDQLSGAEGTNGADFAYLGGSAFIEWLVARQGDSSLVHVWRRLSAAQDRTFDEAFTGVYGESARTLYGRFTAQVTANAVGFKQTIESTPPDSGRLVQRLEGETGDPAISRDGARVAILSNPGRTPGRVIIWSTVPEPDTAAERERLKLSERDPQDVPPVRLFPPPKKIISMLPAVGSQPYQGPRFFRDGRVLVWRNAAVGDGSFVPDLFIWDPQRHTVKRVTHTANVRQADPAPDGATATGLRCASGHCDLVLVDVRSGTLRVLAEGSETRSFFRPRFSADGRTILASVHGAGQWQLATIAADDGKVVMLTSGKVNYYDASFADDSTIVATYELEDVPTLVRLRPGTGDRQILAHLTGAAVGAEFNPADQSVWFLALRSSGWDLRSAPLNSAVRDTTEARPRLAGRSEHFPTPRELPARPIGASRGYGFGPRKWIYVPGGAWSDEGASVTAGLINSDIVGRRELLFQWQGGTDQSWQGASLALTSRASRVPWTASGFMVRQDFPAPISTVLHGGALSLEASRRIETSLRRLTIGGTLADLRTSAGPDGTRALGFATATVGRTRYGDATRTAIQVGMSGTAGTSGGTSVSRGTTSVAVEAGSIPLVISGTAGAVKSSSRFEHFTIGGLTPSLLHPSVLSQRIAMPVLPPAYATGTSLQTYRVSIPLAGFRIYWWGGKVGGDSTSRWERVRGAEWVGSIPQISVIGTPAARLTAGVGTWINDPQIAPPLLLGGKQYDLRQRSRTQFYIMTQLGDWAR